MTSSSSASGSSNTLSNLTAAQNAILIAPLDVIKIRLKMSHLLLNADKRCSRSVELKLRGFLKASSNINARYHHFPTPSPEVPRSHHHAFLLILKEEGIRGLWKGNLSAEYLYLSYGAIQFYTYHEMERWMPHEYRGGSMTFGMGAVAGMFATVLTYPFDLLRTRFAVQGESQVYKGLMDAVTQILRKEGVGGFYRGVAPSAVQIMPYMGVMFWSKDVVVKVLKKRTELGKGMQDFIGGGLAGIMSKTVVMPFDVVRKRLQVQGPDRNHYVVSHIPRYKGNFVSCGLQDYST
ncbi:mitochondrial carrier domain-containing protein [Chytridium lagenaria]|nr:mitochondrial carrier domain-containing protein [Chytridium lagenaria]